VAVEFEPPPAVPRRRGAVAYRIDVRDPLWLDIEDRMQIQLHLSGAPASLEAVLYCVERLV
jgi:predicted component of type VI protein secretion system